MKYWQLLAGVIPVVFILGCSQPREGRPAAPKAAPGESSPLHVAKAPSMPNDVFAELEAQPQPAAGAAPVAALPRKVIRTGDIQLRVADFDTVVRKFRQSVDEIKGAYVAKAEITGSPGTPRRGTWTVRLPAASFDAFMEELAELGVPERNVIDSRDVTEEFYDLEARIRNKKAEEARLVKLLDSSTGKLDEILKVEHEISRARGEVEHMEGRSRMMENLAAMTTVTVVILEVKDYVPPPASPAPQAPTFAARIKQTFGDSTGALIQLSEFVILVLVGLAPWVPVMALTGTCIYAGARISKRRVTIKNIPST